MMPLTSLVPMLHVASVARSIAFYEQLGFVEGNRQPPGNGSDPVWVWLHSGGAQLMLAKAEGPVDPKQATLFYLYCDDVAAFREELVAAGLDAGPIKSPFYAPRGEFRVTDPDGYALMVTHT